MLTTKILIVDDEPENLKTMVHMFSELDPNYVLFQTIKPEKAVDIALKERPDLIITDWEMPNMNGIELIQKFNENSELANTPIIMATGVKLSSADLNKALEVGAVDYIRKPIDRVELMARCNSALKIKEFYDRLVAVNALELAETSLSLVRNKKFKISLNKEIQSIMDNLSDCCSQLKPALESMCEKLNEQIRDDGWSKFHLSFNEVHKGFNKSLLENHPSLTPSELKLCQLIRLGMSSKDISTVQYISYESVKVVRSRLRKKLGLSANSSLEAYLAQY